MTRMKRKAEARKGEGRASLADVALGDEAEVGTTRFIKP